jgi:hypothetical protein
VAKLDEDELRDLIAKNIPDAVFDDTMSRITTTVPSSAHAVVDRSDLARKVAAQRLGIDSHANVAALQNLEEPEPLVTDESKFIGRQVQGPEGEASVKTTVVSTETGEAIAEQG